LPALFQSLRLLRLSRLLRLLRLAPLFRVAFTMRGVEYATVFTVLVAATGAAAFDLAEPDYFDGVYWAVSTMTTVGYGDELPTTTLGQILAMTLMVVGSATSPSSPARLPTGSSSATRKCTSRRSKPRHPTT